MATVYTAYFDASGNPSDSSALFVAGFISTGRKWSRFEQQGNVLLQEYDIKPPFHMKEFAPGAGQYESWKSDRGNREKFMADAVRTIRTNINKSYSYFVSYH